MKTEGESTVCNFSSFPALTLGHNRYQKIARWVQAPEGAAGDRTRLGLSFMPGKNWRRPTIMMFSVTGAVDASLGPVARGSLRVEGDAPAPMSYSSRPEGFLMMAGHNGQDAVYALIDHGKHVEVDLLDANGAVLRTYRWDTSRLSDGVETVSVVGWSCTTP